MAFEEHQVQFLGGLFPYFFVWSSIQEKELCGGEKERGDRWEREGGWLWEFLWKCMVGED